MHMKQRLHVPGMHSIQRMGYLWYLRNSPFPFASNQFKEWAICGTSGTIILLPVVGIEACLVARSQIRAQFQLPDDLTEEEKLEPVRNFGDDPKIRLLNRLYEKKRKVNALPRLDISCCKADWGKRGHAGRQRNSGPCGSSRRWRALMRVLCS